jgi:phosphopantothenoylcysteine decarboxylase/phosphopantothenate--cysteine ligase
MTEAAAEFVTPLTFKEISGNAVAVNMWEKHREFNVEHISLAEWADYLVIARPPPIFWQRRPRE